MPAFLTHYSQTPRGGQNPFDGWFILSASDGENRAQAVSFQYKSTIDEKSIFGESESNNVVNLLPATDQILNKSFDSCLETKLTEISQKFADPIKWIKLEWVTEASRTNWEALQIELKKYKRNYFRSGIAFPSERKQTDTPWLFATETELNAYACLYQGGEVIGAAVNEKNLNAYLKARFGSKTMPTIRDDMSVFIFKTAGIFFDAELGETHPISTVPRTQARRVMSPLSHQTLLPLINKVTAYLGSQVKENGEYEYGHFPCFGRTIGTYNTLRHASSTYALIEGYELCCKENSGADLTKLRKEIELALDHLTQKIIRHYPNELAYVVEINNEIKLGANSVAILALVKYMQVFPDSPRNVDYLNLAEKLANGIVAMQQNNGHFVHILNAETLEVIAESRIIYYDGEAAFALMRLYGITHNSRWLDCVCRAFDYFIVAKHHEAHDHWLSYCSNELVQYKPERKYFEFAINNVKGYVDFIRNRITTFPTLLELSMAFHKMLLKLDEFPQFADVLNGFDVDDFYEALHTRANYLLNGVFFPELAMHYKKPSTILYGCFIRHHAFRVRIDDVEHYLSGWVAYHQLLKSGIYPKSLNETAAQNRTENDSPLILTKENLARATNGTWLIEPADGYLATGLSIFPKRFREGHIIVARGKNMERGYLPVSAVKSLILKGASAIITDDHETYLDFGVPVLLVKDVRKATLDVGAWVRRQYQGNVIGVTGSAGKTTTVAMLGHTLSAFGDIGQSVESANLPVGIAWNISMMNQSAPNWVVEMAIGQMSTNSQIARPNMAIITNIAPAHLEYHHSVEMIAVKKARIFERMAKNSLAIICRDIEQFAILSEKAIAHQLKLVTYGEHPESDIRLLDYQAGKAQIQIYDQSYSFTMKAKGKHQVLNALAVLAVVYHQGYALSKAIAQLETFTAVDGRGEIFNTECNHKAVTVYNEAYNANPLSMAAALAMFKDVDIGANQKLAIIGDMLELGENSQQYHLDLVAQLQSMNVRELVLVGQMMRAVSESLKEKGVKVRYFAEVTLLLNDLDHLVQENDHILVKASNGIGLHSVFKPLL